MKKTIIVILTLAITLSAQSGGNYTIEQSVIGGGGQQSAGGTFSLDGTIGQAVAGGALSGSPFSITSGFWNFTPLAPTAASATVVGRVITQTGRGIINVQITMMDTQGNQRRAISRAFGYFRFNEVTAGETYIFTVKAKRYGFMPDSQVLSINGDVADLVFISDN
ncbi:MAG: carboxypeptidase-like regulatory domain-containing protein [Acidobacteriota bacterium]